MVTILYVEPETGFSYSLVVTKSEAYEISTADPSTKQRITLTETGEIIDFDGNGNALLTSSKGKHSLANSGDLVRSAKESLQNDDV